jgi:adenosylcobinamide-GDP ribazoletransferase
MKNILASFLGAIIFYTIIKLPKFIPVNFTNITPWLTWVGIIIGSLLSLIDISANLIGFSPLTKSFLIIASWIYLTGGLHLDGVIDTADGLAVTNPHQRLKIMQNSTVGAFGVMAGIILVGLKFASLSEITEFRWFSLILATSWGRWGQLMAIALYKYLRQTGKGKFLKENLKKPHDLIIGSLFIIILIIIQILDLQQSWWLICLTQIDCAVIALFWGWWFNYHLGGHTGDTYGATVEWSEAFILCLCSILF